MTRRQLQLLAVLLGLATISCVHSKQAAQPLNATSRDEAGQNLTLEIPSARWEPVFFEALEVRRKKAGVPNLRKTLLPKWKQIRLMRSTRADVEKLMGAAKYRGFSTWYKLDDGVLHIEYYPYTYCIQTGADRKVPQWTVVELIFEPNKQVRLADLNLDLRRFKQVKESPDVPQLISYVDESEGVDYTIDSSDDLLNNVRYFPGKRYDRLRCKQSTGK